MAFFLVATNEGIVVCQLCICLSILEPEETVSQRMEMSFVYRLKLNRETKLPPQFFTVVEKILDRTKLSSSSGCFNNCFLAVSFGRKLNMIWQMALATPMLEKGMYLRRGSSGKKNCGSSCSKRNHSNGIDLHC